MDPQQELFSAVLMALKEKYKDTGVGVYDTILPPKDTPYPFIYLADCSESDQATKNELIGETNLTLKVWHDNIRQRNGIWYLSRYQKDLQVYRTYSALCLEYAETNTKDPAG